jgi:hypothetical protein
MNPVQDYHWECQPRAEQFLLGLLKEYSAINPMIAELEEELRKHTSTNLFDWLDHLAITHDKYLEEELKEAGFVCQHKEDSYRVFHHPGAQLPRILVHDHSNASRGAAVKVDSCADFLMVRGLNAKVEGSHFSCFRRALVSQGDGISLWVVERRCQPLMEPAYLSPDSVNNYLFAREKWQTRPRDLENEDEAMQRTLVIAEELVHLLGTDMAAWIVLEVERSYWESRNLAGQVQKNRQDRMGMGWANHDHHTFRSSRRQFPHLVRLFEILGFHCRERFYAGEEAGWGAQVMENPRSGLVLFLDLDLSPDELKIDFAHHSLPDLPHLGTVGLWCALHGDSILKAGMHHLEAQFSFENLTEDLQHHGIGMMDPFSNFFYLKQAFTHGEQWRVDPKRADQLVSQSKITSEERDKFISYGAVGSHLENLQRKEGYKGFNQQNVSYIIKKTDPRTATR